MKLLWCEKVKVCNSDLSMKSVENVKSKKMYKSIIYMFLDS